MASRVPAQTRSGASRGRDNPRVKHTVGQTRKLHPLVSLQHTAGNLAVQRLLQSGRVQAKLAVNPPGDRFEKEAEHVSETVMRSAGPASPASGPLSLSISQLPAGPGQRTEDKHEEADAAPLQRACAECEEERLGQEDKDGMVQAKQGTVDAHSTTPGVESSVARNRGGGQPLDASTRAFFEPRFGADFSRVRVHTGPEAANAARDVNAIAYTSGHDVVFGAGKYSPETPAGRKLLAHELTHVVQQTGAPPTIQRDDGKPKTPKQDPEAAERAAALKEVAEIEANWGEIKSGAPSFDDLKPWMKNGDAVVALIRDHTQAALDASQKGDTHLFGLYLKVLSTDKTMYDFIAWHTVVYANLLALKPDLDRLAGSFKADDREFTGRDTAEELLDLLKKLTDKFPQQAAGLLRNVSVTETIKVKRGGALDVTITATTAYQNQQFFQKETEEAIKLQSALQVSLSEINKFLDNAFVEGIIQTAEALQQFFEARGGGKGKGPKTSRPKAKRGGDKKPKAQEKKAQEKKPDEKKSQEKKPEEKKPEEKKPEEKKPEDKKKEETKKKKTCASEYPGEMDCSRLPFGYVYPSAQAALAALKIKTGDAHLKLHNPATAHGGPCRGRGMHYNVRSGGQKIASIGCCPCCKDTPAGPVRLTLCGIIY